MVQLIQHNQSIQKNKINLTRYITHSTLVLVSQMSSQQLKEGLLIHLQANRNFIEEKVYKEFAQECIKEHDILTLNTNKMKQVILFTFDFGNNSDMKPFFTNIDKNIKQFLNTEKLKKPPNKKGNVPIDLQNLIELILYCVNHGFDNQPPKPKQQPPKQQPPKIIQKPIEEKKKVTQIPPANKQQPLELKKEQKKKPPITLLNPQLQARVDKMKLITKPIESIKVPARISTRLQPQKILPKVEFKIQKHQMPKITNVGPKYLQTFEFKPKQPQPEPQYQPLDQQFAKNQYNRKIMRQRFFDLFKHYCSQQQNKGHSATFDRIKSEMEHMTIGKFLLFCKSSGIFGDLKLITKQILMNGFKKVAGGKPEIDFDIFEFLIRDLDAKYIAALQRSGKLNHATYEARLRLNSNQGYKEMKKCLNMIFFTRDNKNKDTKMFKTKFDQRDLTGHSGKFQVDLQEELSIFKQSQTIQVISGSTKSNSTQKDKKSRYKALNIEDIGNKKWPKIDWLQEEFKIQQQAMQENSMPKIARRKDVVGNIKKRVEQVSRMEMHK